MLLNSIVRIAKNENWMEDVLKIKLSMLVILLTVSGVAFSAQGDKGERSKAERVDKNAKVCKRMEVPGSHIKKRICKTQRSWDKLTKDSQKLSQEMSSRSG